MGAPKLEISFIEKAKSLIERSERGIVGLILKDLVSDNTNNFIVQLENDIPTWLSDFNKEQIKLALLGNATAPKKVICYVMDTDKDLAEEYTNAFDFIRKSKTTILAIPSVLEDDKLSTTVEYVKKLREEDHKKIIAVLPYDKTLDYEGIVGCNFTAYVDSATNTKVSGEYTKDEYCSRIAGLIAGTPTNNSITYATLSDLTDCNRLTNEEQDKAVDNGELILMNDGEKVKVVRGVSTLKTTTDTKGDSFKKIKIVQIMDLIYDDIIVALRDDYIGKYNNDYDDKCVLMTAVNNYFLSLVSESIITEGSVSIDLDAIRTYLKTKGEDVTEMSDTELKNAQTGSTVYLTGVVKIPDAIEDIIFPIYI